MWDGKQTMRQVRWASPLTRSNSRIETFTQLHIIIINNVSPPPALLTPSPPPLPSASIPTQLHESLLSSYMGPKFEAFIPSSAPIGFHYAPHDDPQQHKAYGDKVGASSPCLREKASIPPSIHLSILL